MTMAKEALSPSHTWSPHTAALHRRRKLGDNKKNDVLGALGGLDLGDDEEDYLTKAMAASPSPKKSGKDAASKGKQRIKKREAAAAAAKKAAEKGEKEKFMTEAELKKSIENHSPTLQRKLLKYIDPSTPMKEKLEIEVEIMRDPEEGRIFADFRYQAERKTLLEKKASMEEGNKEEIAKRLEEERKRAEEEKKEMARKRQEKIEEEIARQEREAKLKKDIQKHKAATIAAGAEELRINAEKTVQVTKENKARKERIQAERERREKEFREGPGKNMTDVECELIIARMMQVEIDFSDDED